MIWLPFNSSWTQEEIDTLYWYYVQSKTNADVVGKIVQLFNNNGNKENKDKSRISIIQQLLQQVSGGNKMAICKYLRVGNYV